MRKHFSSCHSENTIGIEHERLLVQQLVAVCFICGIFRKSLNVKDRLELHACKQFVEIKKEKTND